MFILKLYFSFLEILKDENYLKTNQPESAGAPSGQRSQSNPEAPIPAEPADDSKAPSYSENPVAAQPGRRPRTLELSGQRAEPVATTSEPHGDAETGEQQLARFLKYLPKDLESPVKDPSPAETDILTSFSLLSNGRYIFSFNDSRLLLTSIDGLKFLSLCWVVFAHACLVTETLPALNYISTFKVSELKT